MVVLKYDLDIIVPALVGALLSSIASVLVLLCYAILPTKRHFRHVLIINLAAADVIVHSNMVVAGISALSTHAALHPGHLCSATGWVGQLGVQAVDLSILCIAIVSLLAVTGKLRYIEPSLRNYIGFTIFIWTLPVITSTTGLALDLYRPVNASWCWITREHVGMRYLLGHGIRVVLIFVTIGIYTRLWIFLRQHHKNMSFLANRYAPPAVSDGNQSDQKDSIIRPSTTNSSNHLTEGIRRTEVFSVQSTEKSETLPDTPVSPTTFDGPALSKAKESRCPQNLDNLTPTRVSASAPRRNDVTKILLMNGYPVLYVLLWLPCMVNRVTEVVGTTPRWIFLLQATPQFMGLANALTYGYNENIKRQIKQYWANNRTSKRSKPSAV